MSTRGSISYEDNPVQAGTGEWPDGKNEAKGGYTWHTWVDCHDRDAIFVEVVGPRVNQSCDDSMRDGCLRIPLAAWEKIVADWLSFNAGGK